MGGHLHKGEGRPGAQEKPCGRRQKDHRNEKQEPEAEVTADRWRRRRRKVELKLGICPAGVHSAHVADQSRSSVKRLPVSPRRRISSQG